MSEPSDKNGKIKRFIKNGGISILSLGIAAASFYSACTARKIQLATDAVKNSVEQKAKDARQDERLDALNLDVAPRIITFDAFISDWPEYRGFIKDDHELLLRIDERQKAIDQRVTDLHEHFSSRGMRSNVKP